jgi:hypothetical protein
VSASNVFPPPRRPSQIAAAQDRGTEKEARPSQPASTPLPPEPLACAERLAKIARYTPLPSRSGPGECGGEDLVRVERILMPDNSKVALNPPAELQCDLAEKVAEWVRDDVGPAAAEMGAPLTAVTGVNGYQCRSRNNIKDAKLSEHGRGNALDLTGVRLRNGGVFNLTDGMVAKPFRDRIRATGCARFMTVLGPGSDPYHSDHIHIDLAERRHGTRICQWGLEEQVAKASEEPKPQRQAHAEQKSSSTPDSKPQPEPRVASPAPAIPKATVAEASSPPLPLRKPEALQARAQATKETRKQVSEALEPPAPAVQSPHKRMRRIITAPGKSHAPL